ncbi:hypothetical protein P9112_007823 [Eukaryota sp. TZLM1-RC]
MSAQIEEHPSFTFDSVKEHQVTSLKKQNPEYIDINEITPDLIEINIREAVVLKINKVWDKVSGDGTPVRIYDVLLGDDTGVIHLTARDEQCDFFAESTIVKILGSRSVLYKMHCTLELDQWSKVTLVQNPSLTKDNVKVSEDVSKVEFVVE